MTIVITELNIYPVKSCGGIALTEAHIEPRGFRYDRRWMVVDMEGRFLTQRELPRMALIKTRIGAGDLFLSAPGMDEQRIEFDRSGAATDVSIWRDKRVGAVDLGSPIADWLTHVLDTPVRFVRFDENHIRQVDQQYALRTTDQVGFADAFPYLLISEESLADLNTRLDEPLPMKRFRPNIVVRGADAYAEDDWTRITVGDITFELLKKCARCVITTTDQETAQRGKEPLRTLAMYRNSERGVLFGQNMTSPNGHGVLRVGDEVRVSERVEV